MAVIMVNLAVKNDSYVVGSKWCYNFYRFFLECSFSSFILTKNLGKYLYLTTKNEPH